MINTVTISLEEHKRLEHIEKSYNEKLITYHSRYSYYCTVEPNEAINGLSREIAGLEKEIRRLRRRTLLQRLVNI